jgi:hypothetical protein
VELAPLVCAHLAQRRVADNILDAAAQARAPRWLSPARTIQGLSQGGGCFWAVQSVAAVCETHGLGREVQVWQTWLGRS